MRKLNFLMLSSYSKLPSNRNLPTFNPFQVYPHRQERVDYLKNYSEEPSSQQKDSTIRAIN